MAITVADLRVIGVDPGPTPGIVLLDLIRPVDGPTWIERAEVVQCSAGLALDVVDTLCAGSQLDSAPGVLLVQVEKFVRRAQGRDNRPQQATRDMVAALQTWCEHHGRSAYGTTSFVDRPAAAVLPWATDLRLEKTRVNDSGSAQLLRATKGMRHARDAARHALFCAVHDAGVPDPLSRSHR